MIERQGKLSVSLAHDLSLDIHNSRTASLPITDYQLLIEDEAGQEVYRYEHFADVPESIELEEGNYTVKASSNNFTRAAFETPLYEGEETFEVKAGETTHVNVVCTLANVKVSVIFGPEIITHLDDCEARVGSRKERLVFEKEEGRDGYFKVGALNVKVILRLGDEVLRREVKIQDVEARDWHQIYISLKSKGPSSNSYSFDIEVEQPMEQLNRQG